MPRSNPGWHRSPAFGRPRDARIPSHEQGNAHPAVPFFGPAGSGGGFAFSGDPAWLSRSSRRAQMRPFQLAFILMNIAGMSSHEATERSLVDLIWFPDRRRQNGGLSGPCRLHYLHGTSDRIDSLCHCAHAVYAAPSYGAAIPACCGAGVGLGDASSGEGAGADLGSAEISIGLWVGQSLSPNKRSEAREALQTLKQNSYAQNPFQVLQCPWCGVDFTGKPLGYQLFKLPNSAERTVRFVCPDRPVASGPKARGCRSW